MAFQDLFSLEGRTALVAGASRGLGLAIAQGLAGAGARALLAARSVEALEREAAALGDQGLAAEAGRLDVADPDSIRSVAA
ncbi:MAG: SDR family NAD(P)-dependent oxidoreductase, partial [Acidobacteria bacterium]|nr:SDR family NAD(P)-dependent oxidoreductase [Acidobacteriota bacterium]